MAVMMVMVVVERWGRTLGLKAKIFTKVFFCVVLHDKLTNTFIQPYPTYFKAQINHTATCLQLLESGDFFVPSSQYSLTPPFMAVTSFKDEPLPD